MRILVVVNDAAGGGDAGLYEFVRLVGHEAAEVVLRFVSEQQRAEDLVADACEFDRVVAAGGDGTVSAILYAMRETGVPLLPYPAGTANLLAANLGIPMEPPQLKTILLDGPTIAFDLGELEYEVAGQRVRSGFALMAGAGYDAAIMQSAEPLKPSLGAAAYLVAAVSNLSPTAAEFRLSIDGDPMSADGIAVLLANFGRIQFDLPVTHGTDPRDGVLEVGVVRTKNVVGLIPVVAAAMLDRTGDHPDRSSIDVYSGRSIEVEADPPLMIQADGDVIEAFTPFTARVLPAAAVLVVPPNSPYAEA